MPAPCERFTGGRDAHLEGRPLDIDVDGGGAAGGGLKSSVRGGRGGAQLGGSTGPRWQRRGGACRPSTTVILCR